MSHTVPSQRPVVLLPPRYRRLRAVLAVALIAIVGLTTAVVVLATRNVTTTGAAAELPAAATTANPSAETGAKLDQQGRKSNATQFRPHFPGHH